MLATGIGAFICAAFGMNLVSGLEEAPGVFWLVCGLCSLLIGLVMRSGLKTLTVASRRRYLGDVLTRRRRNQGLIAPVPAQNAH